MEMTSALFNTAFSPEYVTKFVSFYEQHVPNKSEFEPWWQSLKQLWEDTTYYEQQVKIATEASSKHSLDAKTNHLAAVFQKALSIRDERMQK